MTLGDNGKHVAPLTNDYNSEENKNIRLNIFGAGPGIDFSQCYKEGAYFAHPL